MTPPRSGFSRCRLAGVLPGLLAGLLALAGCSSQQLYGAGQGWQQQECQRLADAQERQRCMSSASRSYEEYRREAEAARRRSEP